MTFLFFICFFLYGCTEKQKENVVTTPPPMPLIEEVDLNSGLDAELSEFKLKEGLGVQDICERMKALNMTFVSPGSGVTKNNYLVLRSLMEKYNIKVPGSALENRNVFNCSGSKEMRLERFKEAVDSDYDIIWAVRGGFGSNMLIADMDKMPIPSRKKTFVGFSDVTSLNIFLSQKWNWKVIHAAVLIHLNDNEFSIQNFKALMKILEGKVDNYRIPKVYPLNEVARKTKEVKGPLTGGNLTIVESSLGTCWEIQTDGKVLFLEDNNLNTWRIYRSLYHLQESGKLENVNALVLCRFANCGTQKEIVRMLTHFSKLLKIPVYLTDQVGHGNHNMPLVYNAIATLHDKVMDVDLTETADKALNELAIIPFS